MNLAKFWVVRDPSLESELEDIYFESNANHLASYVLGVGTLLAFKDENHTVYTEEREAKRDAEARMKKLHGKRGGS